MAKKHPGFNKVANNIAQEYEKKGVSPEKAKQIGEATAAKTARNASKSARKANPNLKRVKGASKKVSCKCKK